MHDSLNHIHLPLFMLSKFEFCHIKTVSMLSLSNEAYNMLKSLGYLDFNIIWDS